jgi:uncharacterized protein (TIGR01777 family)
VVQAIEQAGEKPKVLIQASAVGYYGDRGSELVTEETPPGSDFLAKVAVDWENSTAGVEELGVRRVAIRTGVVLSRNGGALPRMLLPFRLFVGGRIGTGRQWFPWIHIEDVVEAISFLLDSDLASGVFNVTAPNPVTNADLARSIGRALGRPAVFPIPAFVLRLMLGELAETLLAGQRAVPRRLENIGFTFRFNEVNDALRDLLA